MVINGRRLAKKILKKLERQIKQLEKKNIYPILVIISLGKDPLSLSFIKQKQKKAESIGVKVIIKNLPSLTSKKKLQKTIQKYNQDTATHGIIVQLPLPAKLKPQTTEIIQTIDPKKDVDGFLKNSPYAPAVALAVLKILSEISRCKVSPRTRSHLVMWLKGQKVLIIGRGPTAGQPIAKTFSRLNYPFALAHSQTKNLPALIKISEVIISCVGKENFIPGGMLKKEAIAIGVGMSRNAQDKLVGDLEEESVSQIAAFYTPTPGGTGPLTVACLLENLVKAASFKGNFFSKRPC